PSRPSIALMRPNAPFSTDTISNEINSFQPPPRALAPPPRPHTKGACFCAVVHRRGDFTGTGLAWGWRVKKNCAMLCIFA
ncbi:hypothetical protein, partial [Xenorhabdus thuongxuanensis]|uniref:hypothetical protein n=1 Tax=Xenorhabdus thuongxuanensis TaxID=1873484 RepID=UPI0039F10868